MVDGDDDDDDDDDGTGESRLSCAAPPRTVQEARWLLEKGGYVVALRLQGGQGPGPTVAICCTR